MPKMQSAPAKSGPFSMFVRSAQELKRPKSLVMLSMLLACHAVLGFFQLQVTDFLRISFAALPIGVAGMLYGPTAALLLGALGDPIKYLVSPTGPFFPGFTLSAAVTGLLFGLLLYGMHQNFAPCRKKRVVAILRVAAAQLLNTLLVDLLLHTLWAELPVRHPHGGAAAHAGGEMRPDVPSGRGAALPAAGGSGTVPPQPPFHPAVILELVQIRGLRFVHFHKSFQS